MYYITTKFAGTKQHALLGTAEKREVAREEARKNNGTVRTANEFDELVAAGLISNAATKVPQADAPAPAPAPEAPAKPVKAVALVEMAKVIKATNHERKTVGKAAKAPKRVATPEAVLAEALVYLKAGVKAQVNKVTLVRGLATWVAADNKTRLQRRDMFALIGQVDYPIAGATISTQFQLARSGKLEAKAKAQVAVAEAKAKA
jgi:hypothetical protein